MKTLILEMKAHPAADMFPLLPEVEFEELKASIEKYGQQVPIVLWNDSILDGRNRYRACIELGLEPIIDGERVKPIGTTAPELVYLLNAERRQLTKTQKACAAAIMRDAMVASYETVRGKKGEKRGNSYVKAGDQVGVGRDLVWKATYVRKECPALFKRAQTGQLSLDAACAELRARRGAGRKASPSMRATPPATSSKIPSLSDSYEDFKNFQLWMVAKGFEFHHFVNFKGQSFGQYQKQGVSPKAWKPNDACRDYKHAVVCAAVEVL